MSTTYSLLGMLYFIQGIPYGLQSGLLPIYFRTVGLSFTKISLTKILYLPWVLKVLWAPIVDQYFTKKTWLLLTTKGLVLACLACSFLTPEEDFLPLAAILLLMNLFASVQDVAVDSLAIQLLGQDQVGYGNTIQVVAYKMGTVLAGGGLLTFIHYLGWKPLFVCLTTLYALAILYVWNADLKMRRSSSEKTVKDRTLNPWTILQELFAVPGTTWTSGFVLIYKLGEQGSNSMFPLFLLDHDFSPQKLGFWNGIVAMAFSITGSSLGGFLMSKQRHPLSLLKVLLTFRCCSLTFQILLMGIYRDSLFIFEAAAVLIICIQHFIAGVITTVTFSIMMHCSQKAKENIQATHYSFLAALEVLGKLAFGATVGSLVDHLGFFSAFFIFLVFNFASVLYLLPASPARV